MLTLNPGDFVQFVGTGLSGRPRNPTHGEVGAFVRFDSGCAVVNFPSMPDNPFRGGWSFNAEEIAEVGTVLHPAEAFVREFKAFVEQEANPDLHSLSRLELIDFIMGMYNKAYE